MATYLPEIRKVTITKSDSEGKKYPAWFCSPSRNQYEDGLKMLWLPIGERNLENFINRFVEIHTVLSKESLGISPDCNLHILLRNGNSLELEKMTVDTS